MAKAIEGVALTSAERVKLEMIHRAVMRGWEASFFHYKNGLLDETEWSGVRNNIKQMLTTEHWREGWHTMEPHFSPSFRELVNGIEEEASDDA